MGKIIINDINKCFIERRSQGRGGGDCCNQNESIQVLKDVNLEFEDGEMVCILGPSGCGKSTLLKLLAGFDNEYTGQITVNGIPVTEPSSDTIFVFQHNGLLPWMTVWQNVELGLRYVVDPVEKRATIHEHIEMVELEGFENHYPHQLSGGMQRRAELARALVVNPEILIMDEPFSGLDFLTHMKMREEVVNMHQYFGKSIIIVTHNIDDALIMGDRVVVMSNRPATVKLDQQLNFAHPRDPKTQSDLQELRDEIFFMLGVSYAV